MEEEKSNLNASTLLFQCFTPTMPLLIQSGLIHSFIHSCMRACVHYVFVRIANLQGLISGALGAAGHEQRLSPK